MSDTLQAALLFLINTLFNLYLFILVIRLVLVWVGADYFNPITQLIIKMTHFIVKPLRGYIPNVYGVESATILLILFLESVKFLLISFINIGMPNLIGLGLLVMGDSINLVLNVFFYAILLQAILSWVQRGSPMHLALYQFTSPIMRPLQRIIPPVGGIDISPIPALIILQFLSIILVNPLMSAGMGAAFG